MKTIIYKIFKANTFKRALRIKRKQQERLERLKEVIDDLRNWNDIPMSWHIPCACRILKIKHDKAAERFIYRLILKDINIEKEARKLPLI